MSGEPMFEGHGSFPAKGQVIAARIVEGRFCVRRGRFRPHGPDVPIKQVEGLPERRACKVLFYFGLFLIRKAQRLPDEVYRQRRIGRSYSAQPLAVDG